MNAVDDYDGIMERESMIQVPQIQQPQQPQQTKQTKQTKQLDEAEREVEERKEEVKPLTIEIANKKAVLRHVKPQESKYWHFKFIDPRHTSQMTNVLQSIQGYRLTVEYGTPINTADIILKMNDEDESEDHSQGEIVGKIHLLLCDKRDANLPSKYYCKLFFFHFKNSHLFQDVKTALVNFFETFRGTQKHLREKSLTDKHRRMTRRPLRHRTRHSIHNRHTRHNGYTRHSRQSQHTRQNRQSRHSHKKRPTK